MTESGHPLRISPIKQFSFKPHEYVYEGYTVTFVCMQLAYYFGFTIVLLVGMDHKYIFDGKPNEKKFMIEDDPNHFDPGYFRNQYWNNPDLNQSEASYKLAKTMFEKNGRKIINLTPETELDIFEKDDMEKWLG
jgi:hypothetical protein